MRSKAKEDHNECHNCKPKKKNVHRVVLRQVLSVIVE
jgi:hypothetical protein